MPHLYFPTRNVPHAPTSCVDVSPCMSHILVVVQVNDFAADAIISQLLLLDSQDSGKVSWKVHRLLDMVVGYMGSA